MSSTAAYTILQLNPPNILLPAQVQLEVFLTSVHLRIVDGGAGGSVGNDGADGASGGGGGGGVGPDGSDGVPAGAGGGNPSGSGGGNEPVMSPLCHEITPRVGTVTLHDHEGTMVPGAGVTP